VTKISTRLFQNLDDLDKNASRSSITLLSISIVYLALYYGAASHGPEILGVELAELFLFYIGAPVIFALFQYNLIVGAGTVALEKEILSRGDGLDPTLPHIRKPTIVSSLFLFGYWARTRRARLVFWIQVVFVVVGLFVIPVVACLHIILWLYQHKAPLPITAFAVFSFFACAVEAVFFAFTTVRKLMKEGGCPSEESETNTT
jgi:hypothetical protein